MYNKDDKVMVTGSSWKGATGIVKETRQFVRGRRNPRRPWVKPPMDTKVLVEVHKGRMRKEMWFWHDHLQPDDAAPDGEQKTEE